MSDLPAKYGRYALITGASSGIGAEFAVQLAESGFNLVLVARRSQKMDALAASLQSRFDVAVEIVELDLAAENATTELVRRTQHVDIGLVIVSAGIFTSGPFIGNTLLDETQLVTVNALVPMHLGHRSLVIPGGTNKFMDIAGKYLAPRPVLTKMYGLLLHRALKTP